MPRMSLSKTRFLPVSRSFPVEGLPRPGLEVRFPTTAFGKNLVFDRERLESNLLQGAFATSAIVAPLIKTRFKPRLDGSCTPAKSKVRWGRRPRIIQNQPTAKNEVFPGRFCKVLKS